MNVNKVNAQLQGIVDTLKISLEQVEKIYKGGDDYIMGARSMVNLADRLIKDRIELNNNYEDIIEESQKTTQKIHEVLRKMEE